MRGGEERGEFNRPTRPVTLPAVNLPDLDVEAEAREAAARVAERRTIREGLDCWRELGRAESYEHWKKIGAALAIGKQYALRTIDPEAPWYQRRYGHTFSKWIKACTASTRRVRLIVAAPLKIVLSYKGLLTVHPGMRRTSTMNIDC